MLCVDDLLSLELFQKLPKNRLDWVCARAQAIEVASGEVLVREGDPQARRPPVHEKARVDQGRAERTDDRRSQLARSLRRE